MIGFDEALARLTPFARPLAAEEVTLAEAHGQVLAADVMARVSSPPADVSAMDGYALREADLAALPARLRIVGESFAGRRHEGAIDTGECVRIFTGAPVPPGADRIVVQEIVGRDEEAALFETAPGKGRHIRAAGSDFRAGDRLLREGSWLGPRQLVAAAAADVARLSVWRRPRVAILSTGDELVPPGSAAGQQDAIPESVSYGVAALAESWGGVCIGARALADKLQTMEAAAADSLQLADLVVVTGGASVGEKDFAKRIFEGEGLELIFSKVAIKPGKPVWLGRARGRLVLGLPGNPASALVTARLFLVPLVAGLAGRDPAAALRWRSLPLSENVGATGDRETFARGTEAEGSARLAANQDSSAQRMLAECGLLIRLKPGDKPLAGGTLVPVLDF